MHGIVVVRKRMQRFRNICQVALKPSLSYVPRYVFYTLENFFKVKKSVTNSFLHTSDTQFLFDGALFDVVTRHKCL